MSMSMSMLRLAVALASCVLSNGVANSADEAAERTKDRNRLAYLDECNPWYPHKDFPKLITPQWVGEEDVEAVIVLGIDDMRDPAKYEQYLRPILNRLKQIDGRAPVSIMTCDVKPDDPQLQSWLGEGVSIECHTIDHPCPLLQGGDGLKKVSGTLEASKPVAEVVTPESSRHLFEPAFAKAKSTYDRCVDLIGTIPGNKPVAFRTPCCDSLNTVSPRFFAEIFDSTTENGNFLQIDSSVFTFFTSEDESLPKDLVLDANGKERFWKYLPKNNKYGGNVHNNFVNYIKNYPYPYLINNSCWEIPCIAPSDWSAQHLHGANNPTTVEDWKAAIDLTVHKQGCFSLVFHPHGWIKPEQVVEMIDHAVEKHGKKVKFLNFREVAERLNHALSGEAPYRTAKVRNAPVPSSGDLQIVDVSVSMAELLSAYSPKFRYVNSKGEQTGQPRIFVPPGKQWTAQDLYEKLFMPLARADKTHNGFFIHDRHFCWINEDTAKLPDLMYRVSFDEILTAEQRQDPDSKSQISDLKSEVTNATYNPVPVGAAVVDITPDYPVRLTGYGNRTRESEGVAARLHARALAVGGSRSMDSGSSQSQNRNSDHSILDLQSSPLAILITVDNCGVPIQMTEAVFARLKEKHGLTRERFAISSTHSHSAPWLRGFAPNIFDAIPDDHTAHLAQYETELIEKLVEVVNKAIAARRPGHLSSGFGETNFAMNRRLLANGKWTNFGEVPDGPTDKRVPVLAAHDTEGKLIAVLANYACHCTTETGEFNQISGDWAGFAADMLEADHPGAVALIAIGCGADANPSPRGTHEQAKLHGRTMADEVTRVLASGGRQPSGTTTAQDVTAPGTPNANRTGGLTPSARRIVMKRINPQITCNMARIDLPLGPLPSRADWEQQATQPGVTGSRARYFLKMLDDGNEIPSTIPDYPVQTWCFGDDLAMVFLGGEVVVDYSIRMNDMFDSDRLWINAYSNDVPCYIASARVLREGGYEADSSMLYYRRPTRLAPEAEDVLCDAVQKLMPHAFYSEELQRDFPAPKSPEESLKCMTTKPDLRVVLAASEPLIHDPVAFDWDERGRLWVVEMGDYPSGGASGEERGASESQRVASTQSSILNPQSSSGRVQILEDTDKDGVYDKATTFLDGLAFPNGIHCWRGGVIITMAPEIFYAEDTDGDGKADVRETLYKGFTEGNQQHRVNGLRWGLDGWLYLANGDSGGEIAGTGYVPASGGRQPSGTPAADRTEGLTPSARQSISLRGRDLRIHPDTNGLDTVSGQTQFGRERDDFGNWFGNNNSNPIYQYVLEDRYVRRNPHAGISQVTAQVATIPGAAPVFPTSRTLARFNDFAYANRFTSACSTMIYRDNYLGDQHYGNAFTSEPVHNLVSRLVLSRDGYRFKGERAADEQESEFLASSDNWFRPTMIRTGPDGAIWVADMYRAVIEHPEWIPPEYQRKMNLYAGNDKGRIYRIVPAGECCGTESSATPVPIAQTVATGNAASADEIERSRLISPERDGYFDKPWNEIPIHQLTVRLRSRNGWWRDTADRILQHRGEMGIRGLAQLGENSHGDLHPAIRAQSLLPSAMSEWMEWELKREPKLAKTHAAIVLAGIADESPQVRCRAIQCLEVPMPYASNAHLAEFIAALTPLADDPDDGVRLQLMLSLGEAKGDTGAALLGEMLRRNFDTPMLRNAGLTSLTPDNIGGVLKEALNAPAEDLNEELIGVLLAQAAAMGRSEQLSEPLTVLVRSVTADSPASRFDLLAGTLSNVLNSDAAALLKTNDVFQKAMSAAYGTAAQIARSNDIDTDRRAAAVRFAGITSGYSSDTSLDLSELLTARTPMPVQIAAVRVMGRNATQDSVNELLSRWDSFAPTVRAEVLAILLQRESTVQLLLDAVETGKLAATDFDAVQRDGLLNYRTGDIAKIARSLFGEETPSARASVVDDFKSQISNLKSELTGEAKIAAGKAVFEKRCSACHRLQDIGKEVGADLAALKDRSTEALLTAVLDPNRAVESKFLVYTVVTKEGLQYSGMLKGETGGSLTLIGNDGKEITVVRADIEEIVGSKRSLMPEGLEKDLSAQDLASVIAFVQSTGTPWKRFAGNSPQFVAANADGTVTLPASAAEIYGPNLVFEEKYGNLGFWSSTEDYAKWTFEVPKSGHWTVEFDFACDNATAGSLIKFSTGNRMLTARVPGSGTWDNYQTWQAGTIDLHRGRGQLIITAPENPEFALIDLRAIRLLPPK